MPYSVPPLPYDYSALEPHIDEATMRVHHDKHHQAYVDKVNAALEGTEWADRSIVDVLKNLSALPSDKQTAVRNNGGGHYNHSLFWEWMSPDGGGEPAGEVAEAINSAFGSFDDFKTKFKATGVNQFGSGWSVARPHRIWPGHRRLRQPGQPDLQRPDSAARRRRMGARLLPQVSEQAPGLHRRVLERRQLAEGRRAARSGKLTPGIPQADSRHPTRGPAE